jgi:hemolysin III
VLLAQHTTTGIGTFSAIVFSVALSLMLGASAVYHPIDWSQARKAILARFDYASIYLLIGASYTPFCLATDLAYGPQILGFAWACALFGAGYSLFKQHASRAIRAGAYVVLGVAMLPNVPNLYRAIPGDAFALVACGGAAYILGALVYVARRPNPIPKHFAHHEVFHLFVFAGAGCHYAAVWRILA